MERQKKLKQAYKDKLENDNKMQENLKKYMAEQSEINNKRMDELTKKTAEIASNLQDDMG